MGKSSKEKFRRDLGRIMDEARKNSSDLDVQAGYVLNRLEELGIIIGQFEACTICGAKVEHMKGHLAWHGLTADAPGEG